MAQQLSSTYLNTVNLHGIVNMLAMQDDVFDPAFYFAFQHVMQQGQGTSTMHRLIKYCEGAESDDGHGFGYNAEDGYRKMC